MIKTSKNILKSIVSKEKEPSLRFFFYTQVANSGLYHKELKYKQETLVLVYKSLYLIILDMFPKTYIFNSFNLNSSWKHIQSILYIIQIKKNQIQGISLRFGHIFYYFVIFSQDKPHIQRQKIEKTYPIGSNPIYCEISNQFKSPYLRYIFRFNFPNSRTQCVRQKVSFCNKKGLFHYQILVNY